MGDLLQPWHLIVLAVVAFLLFGAKRLPELGKGLGEGLKGLGKASRAWPILLRHAADATGVCAAASTPAADYNQRRAEISLNRL